MDNLSPAERYARDRQRRAVQRSEFGQFLATLPYELDDFQQQGCQSIERGASVLVAAPTGAGKTVVGEFAVYLALQRGFRAFYTTPIKALSNQKYHDLVNQHGEDSVGLLTGDTTINGDAPIVVMTTEVLRNMLYAGSSGLDTLGYVVMDEVHYLADRFRGPVWEEVILHLAASVQVIALSATVSNVEEFGAWLQEVRGDVDVVVSDRRPVPLWQHLVTNRQTDSEGLSSLQLVDLYQYSEGDETEEPPKFTRGGVTATEPIQQYEVNADLLALFRTRGESGRGPSRNPRRRHGGRERHRHSRPERTGGNHLGSRRAPSRYTIIDLLGEEELLPAIYFIFSRNGCESAVEQCLAAGLRLTTQAEQTEIVDYVESRCSHLPAADLAALRYDTWLMGLERGIAAHHAGMLPLFKEVVEELFVSGLIKVVFATETLALGINMPARTVVLEKLVKWDGTAHVDITPGEYTQLTGRAGRRGIDIEGHAVIVDAPGLDPHHVVGLTSTRTYPLRSSFLPTYNMSANLIAQVGVQRSRDVLEMSFAQFQADRGVVGLARQAAEQQQALDGYRAAASCDLGDYNEYHRLRQELSRIEKDARKERTATQLKDLSRRLEKVRRGDVLEIFGKRRSSFVVVVAPAELRFEGANVAVLTDGKQLKYLSARDLMQDFAVATRVRVPRNFNPRKAADRNDLSAAARSAVRAGRKARSEGGSSSRHADVTRQSAAENSSRNAVNDRIDKLRTQIRSHPCHHCPERDTHERWAHRYSSLEKEHRRLLSRIEGRTSSIALRFDRVCSVLVALGYASRNDSELTLTEDGAMLRRIYSEKDLLIAQCLRTGAWSRLNPPQLAAVVAATVYEGRRETMGDLYIPGGPKGVLAHALDDTFRLWSELEDLEEESKLDPTPRPELGIVAPIHRWASGRNLDAVLRESELSAGDFVRWCKQVLDVLDQIATVAAETKLRGCALQAMDSIRRGIVSYSGI